MREGSVTLATAFIIIHIDIVDARTHPNKRDEGTTNSAVGRCGTHLVVATDLRLSGRTHVLVLRTHV